MSRSGGGDGTVRRWSTAFHDQGFLAQLVADANDGVVATAGVAEGFAAASASTHTLGFAAFAALITGAFAISGARYAEQAAERDRVRATIDAERERIESLPDAEQLELAQLYVERGLGPDLAREVAAQLTAHDALAAHVDVEYGLPDPTASLPPLASAITSGLAYGLGALIPAATAVLAPVALRIPLIVTACLLTLVATSVVLAGAGAVSILRTLGRTLLIAVLTILIGLGLGRLLG